MLARAAEKVEPPLPASAPLTDGSESLAHADMRSDTSLWCSMAVKKRAFEDASSAPAQMPALADRDASERIEARLPKLLEDT